MDVLFAEGELATKAGKYVMYVLAVAGGYLIGNLLTWIICRITAKLLLKRTINVQLERALRIIGGVIVAALIAFLLFRFGTGWGLGGTGSGEGDKEGGPDKESNPAQQNPTPKGPSSTTIPTTVPKTVTGIKVTILRGADHPKSYRFEGESEGVDLAGAKTKLVALRKQPGSTLQFVDIIIYSDSSAEEGLVVRDLESLIHSLDLKTARKKPQQPLPN